RLDELALAGSRNQAHEVINVATYVGFKVIPSWGVPDTVINVLGPVRAEAVLALVVVSGFTPQRDCKPHDQRPTAIRNVAVVGGLGFADMLPATRNQQRGCLVQPRPCLLLRQRLQVLGRYVPWRTTVPCVGLAGVRVDAVSSELLAVAKNF